MRLPLFLSFALILAAPAWATPQCARNEEAQAFNIRALQSELMVAAIACGQRDDYNRFVRTHQNMLQSESRHLQDYFRRIYSASALREQDRFITRLANESAQQQVAQGRDAFCAATAELFESVLNTPSVQLANLTEEQGLTSRHGIPSCGTQLVQNNR